MEEEIMGLPLKTNLLEEKARCEIPEKAKLPFVLSEYDTGAHKDIYSNSCDCYCLSRGCICDCHDCSFWQSGL